MRKLILFLSMLTFSINANAQWMQAPNPENVRLGTGGFAQIGDTLFTGTSLTSGFDGDLEALYKSGDQGLTWIKADAVNGLTNQNIDFLSVTSVDSTLFLASVRYLQSSKDGGRNWIIDGDFQRGDEHIPVHFVKLDSIIVGAAQGDTNDGADGVFRKVGDGDWEAANEGLPEGRDDEIAPQVFSMIENEGRILATFASDVYFSDDTAKTWTRFTGFGTYINHLAAGNGIVLGAGFRSGQAYIYKSSDNGVNFERLERPDDLRPGIRELHYSDGFFYAALEANFDGDGGIYISEDGESWSLLGLKNARITDINTTDEKVLVTVQNWIDADSLRGVWTLPKSEVIFTSSEIEEDPSSFVLNPNYPNPFNPSTSISFELKTPGYVELEVFNMLGQKIATLVEGFKSSGSHSVTFEARNLTSGIYLYRLSSGNSTQIRKMMLIK